MAVTQKAAAVADRLNVCACGHPWRLHFLESEVQPDGYITDYAGCYAASGTFDVLFSRGGAGVCCPCAQGRER